MGKNRDIEELINRIVAVIIHKILERYTNRPESRKFLSSEVVEYTEQANKSAQSHNWNDIDRDYIMERALQRIVNKMNIDYSDVEYDEEFAKNILLTLIREIM